VVTISRTTGDSVLRPATGVRPRVGERRRHGRSAPRGQRVPPSACRVCPKQARWGIFAASSSARLECVRVQEPRISENLFRKTRKISN